MPRDYLTAADVLGMHTALMQRYGDAPGVRDPGALEAALFRPQTGYYEDVVAGAAALMESLAINRPFVDGNKRIAFAAADVFLRINGAPAPRAGADLLGDDADVRYRDLRHRPPRPVAARVCEGRGVVK